LSKKPPKKKQPEIPPHERYAISKGIYTMNLLPFEYLRLVLDRVENKLWLEGKYQDIWLQITPKITPKISEVS